MKPRNLLSPRLPRTTTDSPTIERQIEPPISQRAHPPYLASYRPPILCSPCSGSLLPPRFIPTDPSSLPSRTSPSVRKFSIDTESGREEGRGSKLYLLKIAGSFSRLSIRPVGRKISRFFFSRARTAAGEGGRGGGYIPFPVVIVVGLHPVGREDERGGRRQRSVARVGGRTPVEWYIDRRQRCTVEWFRGECSGETHGVARSGD